MGMDSSESFCKPAADMPDIVFVMFLQWRVKLARLLGKGERSGESWNSLEAEESKRDVTGEPPSDPPP